MELDEVKILPLKTKTETEAVETETSGDKLGKRFFLPYVVLVIFNILAFLWWYGLPLHLPTSLATASKNNDNNQHLPLSLALSPIHNHNVRKKVQHKHKYTHHQNHNCKCCNVSTEFDKLLQIASPIDQNILAYINCYHLSPPAEINSTPPPHQLSKPIITTDQNSSKNLLQNLFQGRLGGFFIESQPSGHERPYTLSLERNANWTGLVLETNPIKLLQLVSLYRNSWISNACLSSSSKGSPSMIIQQNVLLSKCYSLVSYLSLLNRTSVDLLRLSGERKPWEVVQSTFLHHPSIHFEVIDISHDKMHPSDKELLKNFLVTKKYNVVAETPKSFVFQHPVQSQHRIHRSSQQRQRRSEVDGKVELQSSH